MNDELDGITFAQLTEEYMRRAGAVAGYDDANAFFLWRRMVEKLKSGELELKEPEQGKQEE